MYSDASIKSRYMLLTGFISDSWSVSNVILQVTFLYLFLLIKQLMSMSSFSVEHTLDIPCCLLIYVF